MTCKLIFKRFLTLHLFISSLSMNVVKEEWDRSNVYSFSVDILFFQGIAFKELLFIQCWHSFSQEQDVKWNEMNYIFKHPRFSVCISIFLTLFFFLFLIMEKIF